MRRKMSVLLVISMLCMVLAGCDDEPAKASSESSNSEQSEAAPSAEQSSIESATIMVYMTASDLESNYGCATNDINEMLYGNLSDNVHLVFQTGGTSQWQNSVMDANSVERWVAGDNGEIEKVGDLGIVSMVEPDTLSDFVTWATTNYPADRYGFIFWDHGGGTAMGYGLDENFPDDSLSIGEISQAFYNAGAHFDFVGFDACLMGTVENAYLVSPYADYMIASEETEPGDGWYYTNFISAISENPGIDITELGKLIVDDYFENLMSGENNLTLSVVDLTKIDAVMMNLYAYMEKSDAILTEFGYDEIASARAQARDFGDGGFEQIDLLDYINRVETADGSALAASINDAIVYNATTLEGANGLAMYYPYYAPEAYDQISSDIQAAGISEPSYVDFFNDFVSIMVYGHANHQSSASQYVYQQSDDDWSNLENAEWFSGVADSYANQVDSVETDELVLDDKGEYYALALSDEDWDIVAKIEQQAYVDDGEGYLELGYDDAYRFDDDGDLIVEFDYTWLCLNDCLVPFYAEKHGTLLNGTEYTYGYIPATLNNEKDIKIMVCWDTAHEGPYVKGYCEAHEGMSMSDRGLQQLKKGDQLEFYFDYYNYDGDFVDGYALADNSLTYDGGDLTVAYQEIGDCVVNVCFHLEDVYQNDYWTETIVYGE